MMGEDYILDMEMLDALNEFDDLEWGCGPISGEHRKLTVSLEQIGRETWDHCFGPVEVL